MKKILLTALSVAAIVGCAKEVQIKQHSRAAISFAPNVPIEATRGTTTLTSTLQNFQVWGWAGTAIGTTPLNGFGGATGEEYTKESSGNLFAPTNSSNLQYWNDPTYNSKDLVFWATSPVSNGLNFSTFTSANKTLSALNIDTDYANQKDIIVAATKVKQSSGSVALNFKHILSKIEVQAKVDKSNANFTNVKVYQVRLGNVYNNEAPTFAEDATNYTNWTCTFDASTKTNVTYTGKQDNTGVTLTDTWTNCVSLTNAIETDASASPATNANSNEGFFLIPQNRNTSSFTAKTATQQDQFVLLLDVSADVKTGSTYIGQSLPSKEYKNADGTSKFVTIAVDLTDHVSNLDFTAGKTVVFKLNFTNGFGVIPPVNNLTENHTTTGGTPSSVSPYPSVPPGVNPKANPSNTAPNAPKEPSKDGTPGLGAPGSSVIITPQPIKFSVTVTDMTREEIEITL